MKKYTQDQIDAMTDDQIAELDPETFEVVGEAEEGESDENASSPDMDQEEDEPVIEAEEGETDADEGGAESDVETQDPFEGTGSTSSEEDEEGSTSEEPAGEADPEAHQATEDSSSEDTGSEETEGTDYQLELEKILAPMKAAKRTITVKSADEARRLMQMGIDYSQKMRDMKPYQKVLKTLQRNDLLDMNKLNFLIDLDNKNPDAIKKLLKDSEIDPVDLDLEKGEDYRPNDHSVSDAEISTSNVIDNLRDRPTFDRTVELITEQWDEASKTTPFKNPSVIADISDHMEAGIFDMIADRLATEKLFGKHSGLMDLAAYKAVGDAMFAEGAFNQPVQKAPAPVAEETQENKQPDGSDNVSAKRKQKRKAAGSPRGGPSAGKKVAPDWASMTDDQIENFDISSL
jgi:hypothetical protein